MAFMRKIKLKQILLASAESSVRKTLFILLIYLAMPFVVQAESIDCVKARTSIEKEICNNRLIKSLDDEMDLAYLRALERTDDRHKVQQAQQQWLTQVRNVCPTEGPCLLEAYNARVEELNAIPTHKCYWLEPPRKYEGKRSEVEPICRAMEENLNQFCDQPPMACEIKIAPQFKNIFLLPDWQPINRSEVNPALVEKFLRAPYEGSYQKDQEDIWNEERPKMEAAFKEDRISLSMAELDLYNIGKAVTAYRLDYGNCQDENPQLKVRKRWGDAIKYAEVFIGYAPDALRDIGKQALGRPYDSFFRGIFIYNGKVYDYRMGSVGGYDSPLKHLLTIHQHHTKLFEHDGAKKQAIIAVDTCEFNYHPVGEYKNEYQLYEHTGFLFDGSL